MRDDTADLKHLFAASRERGYKFGGATGIAHRYHADAAVERAGEFRRCYVAGLRQPPEHGWQRPTAGIDLAAEAGRQHARDVPGQAAAGDVSQRLQPAYRMRREASRDVDAGRREQSLAQAVIASERRGSGVVEAASLHYGS